MTSIIKAKRKPRELSVATTLESNFMNWQYINNGRGIVVACSPENLTRFTSDQWTDAVLSKVSEIAESKGLEISSYEKRLSRGISPVVEFHFSSALKNFNLDLQSDLLTDLQSIEHNNGMFTVSNVKVIGNKDSGTVTVEWDLVSGTSKPDAKVHLRETIKDLFKRVYHKRLAFQARSDNKMVFAYKDIPELSER